MFPFSIATSLVPYTAWIKVIAVLAIVAAIFGFGCKVGSDHEHVKMQSQVDKVSQELASVKDQWAKDKIQWTTTLAKQADDAIRTLQATEKRNADELKSKQDQIDAANSKSQQAQKVNDAKVQTLLDRIAHPVAAGTASAADLGADGLWVDADSATCTSDQDGSSLVSQAAAARSISGPYRCRLSESTADRLVKFAAEANEVVRKLNLCVSSLEIDEKTTASQSTTTVTDNQDSKGLDLTPLQPEQEKEAK